MDARMTRDGSVTTRRERLRNDGGPGRSRARVSSGWRGVARCYLIMIDASTSTWAHLVPVLHALGLSVLFLPSTVTVTVCVPAAMASRAQTMRRGCAVAE